MKNLLGIIFLPVWAFGFLTGLLVRPWFVGFLEGYYCLELKELKNTAEQIENE